MRIFSRVFSHSRWLLQYFLSMTTSFLEKFKGKTQQVGKQGLMGLMGDGQNPTSSNKIVVQTNIQFKPQYPTHQRQKSIEAQNYNGEKHNYSRQRATYTNNAKVNQSNKQQLSTKKVPEQHSPFHVMNAFCLDDQEPGQPFIPPLSKKQTSATHERQLSQVSYKQPSKKITVRENSTENKGWTKLGGLGANIGGEDWNEKKKKLQKMQEFAQQVKLANQQKAKQRKPFEQRESQAKKEKTIRQKALQYSKNIPKPMLRRANKKQSGTEEVPQPQNKYSELEQYERRHKELQRMLNH